MSARGAALSDQFEEFRRAAQKRAAQPAGPSYAERLRALNDELRDPEEERRAKIAALATSGATTGERTAARAALRRMDEDEERRAAELAQRLAQDVQDEEDYLEARAHGAA